jgi:hypothetical protein
MKIIQIATSAGSASTGNHDAWETLFALTDDGKIYMIPYASNAEYSQWKQLPPIPEEV